MGRLVFFHGVVGAGKTLALLTKAHRYKQCERNVLIVKPELDTRVEKVIKSRSGLVSSYDYNISTVEDVLNIKLGETEIMFVDEVQFLSEDVINALRDIATETEVTILCYGLKTDFKGRFFEGSKRILEIADEINELNAVCFYCKENATMNLRIIDGNRVYEGDQILLGFDEYKGVCYKCYRRN